MITSACLHPQTKKHGRDRNRNQRHRCVLCGVTWIDKPVRALGDMRLPPKQGALCVKLLMEGMSIRSTERLTGVNRNTIMHLLEVVGEQCQRFWEAKMRDIPARDVQCDELWGFVGMKEKTRKRLSRPRAAFGDCYCYLAIERHTKLVLAWHVANREGVETDVFVDKLHDAVRPTDRPQVTTDGYMPYRKAIPNAFYDNVDFAQLVKIYTGTKETGHYSPGVISQIRKHIVSGEPDDAQVCTSHAERVNLTIRMSIRRMTRLTNGFSKKWENHEAHFAVFFVWYNFCRKHQTLGTTPAVASGIADAPWTVERMLEEIASATQC
jgi:transposase-like protein/IS1 family transposase